MNFINNQHEDAPPGAAQTTPQPMVEKAIADVLAARVAELEKENANLHECYEYTKAGDYFQEAAIDFLSHMREHIDEQGKFRGNSQWRLNEVAEAILELEKANKERLAAASTSEEKRPLLITELAAARAEVERLRELVTEIHPTVIECWIPAPLDSRLNDKYQSWAERALPMLKLQNDYGEGEA